MNAGKSIGLGRTALHRNPFTVLGASMASSRAQINELAEDKAFVLDEAVVQDARRELTNPRSRLSAEIAWLAGLTDPEIDRLVAPGGLEQHIHIPVTVPALTRANVLAAWFELQMQQIVSVRQVTSQLTVLFQLNEQIDAEATRSLLNERRVNSGFVEIEPAQLHDALREQRSYYARVCQQMLEKFLPEQRATIIANISNSTARETDLFHRLVDEYAFIREAWLREKESGIESETRLIRRFPKSSEIEIDRLIKQLEEYKSVVWPILRSFEARGLEYEPAHRLGWDIRGLYVTLANDHDQLELAQKIATAFRDAFGEINRFSALAIEELQTLANLITERDQYLRALRAHSQQTYTPRSTSYSTDRQDQQPGAPAPTQEKGLWESIPGVFKLAAIVAIMIWGGNAVTSEADSSPPRSSQTSAAPTRASSSASRSPNQCAGIRAWWRESSDRYDRLMDMANAPGNPGSRTQVRMSDLVREQRLSNPPRAAADYNDALVKYMQFAYDSARGRGPIGYAWQIEDDRLFETLTTQESDAASKCNITLIGLPNSQSAMFLADAGGFG